MTDRPRVLFVDDEAAILDSLRDLLRKDRVRWDMTFAGSGAAALDAVAAQPFDIVVSDMRMPGMNGDALLSRIKTTDPGTARLVLSGQADRDTVLRTVPVAHQFLSKPCEANRLRGAIERAAELRTQIADPAIRAVVGGLTCLPSSPHSHAELVKTAADPMTTIGGLAPLVEIDPAASAKILQLVSSAYFGTAQTMTSISHATHLIGIEMLRALASASTFTAFSSTTGFSIEGLQMSSIVTAQLASAMLHGSRSADAAFAAAMLRDVGEIVLALAPQQVCADHAAVGAYLLGLWGLPRTIVDAVAVHHQPSRAAEGAALDVVAAVHVADAMIDRGGEGIDEDFLARAGVAAMLPRWRDLADTFASGDTA